MREARRAARPMSALSRRMIVTAAAGVALFLAGCGSSSPASKPTVPKNFFGVDPGTPADGQDFQGMADASVESFRVGLGWAAAQSGFGGYNWTAADTTVGNLAAHGIDYLPVLSSTPAWIANQGTTPPVFSPQAKRAWTAFLQAAVKRYGPDGAFWQSGPDGEPSPFHALCHCDAHPMPITSWQVWNEPTLVHYFTPTPSVARYAELLRISHDAIKSQDPHAKIVLAGVPGYAGKGGLTAWQFLRRLLRRPGVADDFDVAALHPYAGRIGQLEHEISKVRAVMREQGQSSKPLWITEVGWGSAQPDRFGLNKGIQGQKRFLTRAFRLLLRDRARWNLDRVYWFAWRDPPASGGAACSFCGSAGLLRNDRQPKPAYRAFTHFTHRYAADRYTADG